MRGKGLWRGSIVTLAGQERVKYNGVKAIKPKGGKRVIVPTGLPEESYRAMAPGLFMREEMRTRNWLPGQRFRNLSCQQPGEREEENIQ